MTEQSAQAGRKSRVAWGITGSGDRLPETISVMEKLQKEYRDKVDVKVYLSRQGSRSSNGTGFTTN